MADEERKHWPVEPLPDACEEADTALMSEIAPWVQRGQVSVEHGSDSYFSLIRAKYPIGVGRIDWSHVRDARFHEFMAFGLPEYPLDFRLEKLMHVGDLLLDWFHASSIPLTQRVTAVGDISNIGLSMSLTTFLECCSILFTSGQHIYVVPSTAEWCLHYSTEDTLNFGWAKNSIVVGPVIPDGVEDADDTP